MKKVKLQIEEKDVEELVKVISKEVDGYSEKFTPERIVRLKNILNDLMAP